MKLFARTLLIFLVAISIQAVLTTGLIMGLVSRNNDNTARTELREESVLVYNNYNSWVREIWKYAIRLKDNSDLKVLIETTDNRSGQVGLINGIHGILKDSGLDSFIIRQDAWDHFEIMSDAYPFIDDFQPFNSDRPHPYVSLKRMEDQIFLTATIRLSESTQLFLLKHFDDDFYNLLEGREHTRVIVSTDKSTISQVFGSRDALLPQLNGSDNHAPYWELFDLNAGQGHYNMSIQNIGLMDGSTGDEPVSLLVILSTELYRSILTRIGRIVLMVSLVILALTAIMALFLSGQVTRPIKKLVDAMKQIRDGDFSATVDTKAGGEVRDLLGGFNEMTRHLSRNRTTMDDNLQEITFLKDYNETIIHSLQAGIIVVDRNLIIEKVNGFFVESFPQSRGTVIGMLLDELTIEIMDEDVCNAAREITCGLSQQWSKTKRVENSVWDIKLYPLKLDQSENSGQCVIEFDDISRKMELEEKIFQAEKLTSLSFLSAGIAHEINNPLSTILSNTQHMLTRDLNDDDKDSLKWIEQETNRIAAIIRELLDFSHIPGTAIMETDVNECLTDVIRLVRYGLNSDEGVTITLKTGQAVPSATVPPDELKQLILNLVQNAVHAVDGRGSIHVETSQYDDGYVSLTVSDDGPGIPDQTLPRIFDPFFTTKPDGIGTGLGLSIVYGIVKKAGGDIDVDSGVDSGTTFRLRLPIGKG